jgi:hypothetical protein
MNKTKNKDGTVREYVQIVESVRVPEKKHPVTKVVATLGRRDQIVQGQFDALVKALADFSEFLTVTDLQEELRLIVLWNSVLDLL